MTEFRKRKQDMDIEEEQDMVSGPLFGQKFIPPDELKGNDEAKYKLSNWWAVLQSRKFSPYKERVELFERALLYVPSLKIWEAYLDETVERLEKKCILSSRFQVANQLFERAINSMSQLSKKHDIDLWLKYVEFLGKQKLITKTRQAYNLALRCLEVQDQEKLWYSYCEWALQCGCMRTTKEVINRYLKIDEDYKEKFGYYLLDENEFNEAARVLFEIIQDERFSSKEGRTKFEIYMELCNLVIEHPEINSVDKELVIRDGIKRYTDEVGNLWVKLADYHTRIGDFDKARQVFEEALTKIQTSRDFGIIFNAYTKLEEELVNVLAMQENEDQEMNEEYELELDAQVERLEKLLDRRKILHNDCLLRQNKNSVKDWISRINIFKEKAEEDPIPLQKAFGEAVKEIEPENAENGSLVEIWNMFAQFYVEYDDLANANQTYFKATQIHYKTVDEQTLIWKYWVETLLLKGFYKDAIMVIKQALFGKRSAEIDKKTHHNVQLWELYIDLENNFGTFETQRIAYGKMMDLKVITPFVLLNYAQLLEEHHYYEDSFKVYEAGLQIFTFPSLYEIWLTYLTKFIDRYEGEKLERARGLFEKILTIVPKKKSKIFYFMYADYEEKYGLLNHMFEIYDRMVANVQQTDRLDAYNLYIAKVAEHLGVTKTRPIFENAIANFEGDQMVQLGMRYAALERKFGEVDRARAIYIHISQFADPRGDVLRLWTVWEDFEKHHGNIDTYKEYMRIKRSVLQSFNILPPDVKKIKELVEKGEL
ncbi:hypothetical protein ABPG72_008779 [Tetrahymena utriculariae]